MRKETIVDVLSQMRQGEWFGFNGKEPVYENLVILTSDEKPTKEWLEAEIIRSQDAWDAAKTKETENKASAKSKLVALGLSEDEISTVFGI